MHQLEQDQATWSAEQQCKWDELTERSQTLDARVAEIEAAQKQLLAERESWNSHHEQQHAELSARSQEFADLESARHEAREVAERWTVERERQQAEQAAHSQTFGNGRRWRTRRGPTRHWKQSVRRLSKSVRPGSPSAMPKMRT